MTEFNNNDFKHDNSAQHALRCVMCVTGILKHAAEIDLPGTLADDMIAHRTTWDAMESDFSDQMGDQMAATALIAKLQKELCKLIVSARYMVQSICAAEETGGVIEHEIIADFGAVGSIPKDRLRIIALAKKMVEANARYVALGKPQALPEAPFAILAAKIDELEEAIKRREIEKSERYHASLVRKHERIKGDKLLSSIFRWLCAIWGYDDFTLLGFGFVPKSQILTKKRKVIDNK